MNRARGLALGRYHRTNGEKMMWRTIIALLATTALAAPAVAQQATQDQGTQQSQGQQQTEKNQQQTGKQSGQQAANQRQGGGPSMLYDAQSLDEGEVRQIQLALNKKGFHAGSADGTWGEETRSAILNFQKAQGIKQTGQLDEQTVSALGVQLDQASMHYDMQNLSQEHVLAVQRHLNQKGFDAGAVDGIWDDGTRSALRNFQKSQGMKQTGSLDQKTASALGVQFAQQEGGSETTGAASQRGGMRNQQDSQQSGEQSGKQK
jgi:peptidoglycan hydrolase-like protein with peptidoglycan-binding domain